MKTFEWSICPATRKYKRIVLYDTLLHLKQEDSLVPIHYLRCQFSHVRTAVLQTRIFKRQSFMRNPQISWDFILVNKIHC